MQRLLQSRKSKCERPVALGGSMDSRMRRAVRAGERTGRSHGGRESAGKTGKALWSLRAVLGNGKILEVLQTNETGA